MVLVQREFRRRFPGPLTPTGQTLRCLATRLEEYEITQGAALENADSASAVSC